MAGVEVREHQWADALEQLTGASIPLARFGASDCGCRAHLVHTEVEPSLSEFLRTLRAGESRHPRVSEYVLSPNDG
jgi:hypothetical protein